MKEIRYGSCYHGTYSQVGEIDNKQVDKECTHAHTHPSYLLVTFQMDLNELGGDIATASKPIY